MWQTRRKIGLKLTLFPYSKISCWKTEELSESSYRDEGYGMQVLSVRKKHTAYYLEKYEGKTVSG